MPKPALPMCLYLYLTHRNAVQLVKLLWAHCSWLCILSSFQVRTSFLLAGPIASFCLLLKHMHTFVQPGRCLVLQSSLESHCSARPQHRMACSPPGPALHSFLYESVAALSGAVLTTAVEARLLTH